MTELNLKLVLTANTTEYLWFPTAISSQRQKNSYQTRNGIGWCQQLLQHSSANTTKRCCICAFVRVYMCIAHICAPPGYAVDLWFWWCALTGSGLLQVFVVDINVCWRVMFLKEKVSIDLLCSPIVTKNKSKPSTVIVGQSVFNTPHAP